MYRPEGLEQIRGLQFEIWCERLFSGIAIKGYAEIRRNVHYHKPEAYRQVDLEYFNLFSLDEHFVMLEMKYHANGKLPLELRGRKRTKRGQTIPSIDTVIDETEERRKFIGADRAILVSNSLFSSDLINEANKTGIILYDGNDLQRFDKQRRLGYIKPIFGQIKSIDIDKYNNDPYRVNL